MKALLLLAGALGLSALPATAAPPPRFAVIDVAAPGLMPEAVEARITTPLEAELRGVPSVSQVRSLSAQGRAQIAARLDGPGAEGDLARIRLVLLESAVARQPGVTVTVEEQAWPKLFSPEVGGSSR